MDTEDFAQPESSSEPEARAVRLSITIRPETKARLDTRRSAINVSQVADTAINRELDRLEQPAVPSFVERLRGELTERRGPEWSAGYEEGQSWGEQTASWLQLTLYATRYGSSDVVVVAERNRPYFSGRFHAPDEDYGEESGSRWPGAPAFRTHRGIDDRWEDDPWKCQRYWRGWLAGTQEVYAVAAEYLPDVRDQLPPEPKPLQRPSPTYVEDPDDIPF